MTIERPMFPPTRRGIFPIAAGAVALACAPAAAAECDDPIFALIEAKREADVEHSVACDVLNEAEKRFGFGSDEADAAFDAQSVACHAAYEACVLIASTPPTTLAGILAVFRLVDELLEKGIWIEDMDLERQFIATTADAIEAIVRKGAAA